MTDLNVLFLTRRGEGYVGAPSTRHGFEMEAAKHCTCRFAGEGWPLYRSDETIDMTVKRVMPNADLVIDRDNNLHNKKPQNRRYKVGLFISDLHGKHYYGVKSPLRFAEMINEADYDAVYMRYPLIYGTEYNPRIVYDTINCVKHWVPWSVDPLYWKQKHKRVDVAFIGSTGRCYPLRNQIWENLETVAKGYTALRQQAPHGSTYERGIEKLGDKHLVGDRYRDALAETRILVFGCSVYRYPLQKFFEGAASQCLIMSNKPGMAERLGFIDEKTYVEITEDNWGDKLRYYLETPSKGAGITRRGMKNVLQHHSHKVRAKQWVEKIKDDVETTV